LLISHCIKIKQDKTGNKMTPKNSGVEERENLVTSLEDLEDKGLELIGTIFERLYYEEPGFLKEVTSSEELEDLENELIFLTNECEALGEKLELCG
jgi:hypothetical protein